MSLGPAVGHHVSFQIPWLEDGKGGCLPDISFWHGSLYFLPCGRSGGGDGHGAEPSGACASSEGRSISHMPVASERTRMRLTMSEAAVRNACRGPASAACLARAFRSP